jgi:hypothetical protein
MSVVKVQWRAHLGGRVALPLRFKKNLPFLVKKKIIKTKTK